jgi:hypothetical protein
MPRIGLGIGLGVGRSRRVGEEYFGSAYVGPVATRCGMPTSRSSQAKTGNSRTFHKTTEALTAIQVVLPNWYWPRASTGPEAGSGGTITYEAAIEKLDGTFTRITFAGANSAVVADGNNLVSDMTAISLPENTGFYLRVFNNAAVNMVFTDGNASPASWQVDFSMGEAFEYAASGFTSKVMGGTITHNLGVVPQASVLRPIAILGTTKKATVGILGNSRDWGFGDNYDSGLGGGLGDVARAMTKLNLAYVNMGSASDTMTAFIAAHAKRLTALNYCSHIVIGDVINALRSAGENQTAAATLAQIDTIMGYFPTKRILLTTLGGPNSSSSNSFIDAAGQTVNANQAQMTLYNDAIRAGRSPAIGFVEIDDQLSTARNSGKWWTNGGAFGTTVDGLHSSQLSYQRVRDSGAFKASMFSRVGL